MNYYSDKNLQQRLTIFTIISFILPVIMAIPLYIAKTKGIDVTMFGKRLGILILGLIWGIWH